MKLGMEDMTVLVTGASSNIGRAIATTVGREGARVAVTYRRRREAAHVTVEEIRSHGGSALAVSLDLASSASVDAALGAVVSTFGGVDALINNAVEWPTGPQLLAEDGSAETLRRSLSANLLGPYRISQAVLGHMRQRGWGRIVHVSTGLVDDGLAGSAAYVTAKAGLHGLTRVMSRELAGEGILTNVVMAGFTPGGRTPPDAVLEEVIAATATGRTTTGADVANVVAFLASAANTHVTGEAIRVDGHFLSPHLRGPRGSPSA